MSETTMLNGTWKVITDPKVWDRCLASLNGHPLQSAKWGEARSQIDGHNSLYLMFEGNEGPLWMARVETRKLPLLGKVAWIPRGPSKALHANSSDLETGLRKELQRNAFSLIITDEYEKTAEETSVHTIWIDLEQGLDVLKKRIDKQWMYGVRRAGREGVEVVCATTAEEVHEFFQMCIGISQSKGFELPGSEALMQHLLEPSDSSDQEMFLFLAKHDGKIGAGAFVARSGKHIHYFWGASDRKMSKQRVGEAVQWAIIEWAAAQGCTRYDLEGIDPANNPGVYAFKKKMGGDEITLAGKEYVPLNIQGRIIYQVAKIMGKI